MTTANLKTQQEKALQIARSGAQMAGWTNNEALVIHRMYAKDANQAEFMAFARICRTTGLDPLNSEIFCTIYSKDNPSKRSMVIITAVAGFRKIGFATGEVTQLEGPFWLNGAGNWVDVWTDTGNPVAARFGIARTGMLAPRMVTVTWKEFAKDVNKAEGDFWKRMPSHMLAKVAESQAWRAVFPAQLNELHDDAEVGDGMPPPDIVLDAIAEGEPPRSLPVAKPEPPPAEPEPEWDAAERPPKTEPQYDMGRVLTILLGRMMGVEPTYAWEDLARITGWPEGADKATGITALLQGAVGTEEELASMVFASLEATRS